MSDHEEFLAQRHRREIAAAEAVLNWMKSAGAGALILDDENSSPGYARGYTTADRPTFDELRDYTEIPLTDALSDAVHDYIGQLPTAVRTNIAPSDYPHAYNPAVSILDLETWLADNR